VQSVGVVARINTNTGIIVVNMQGRMTRDGAFATAAQGTLADGAAQRSANITDLNNKTPISATIFPHADFFCAASSDAVTDATMCKFQYKSPSFEVRSLQLVFADIFSNYLNTETTTPKLSIRAAIEYPAGTFIPVFFDGKRDVVLESGSVVTSEPADLIIPAATNYFVRVFAQCSTGLMRELPTSGVFLSTGGGGVNYGKSGAAATATTTVASNLITSVTLTSSGSGYPPNTEITCTITGGGGASGDVRAYVNSSGLIENRFRIVNQGSGYTSAPSISIPGNVTGSSTFGGIPVDLTTSGTLVTNLNFASYGPSAILANPNSSTKYRSYLVIGDSIAVGFSDSFVGYRGWVARVSENYNVPMVNASVNAAGARNTWLGNTANWKKIKISKGVTDVIIALGSNDLIDGRTSIQIQDDITTLITRFINRGLRVHLCTIPPRTNGSNVPSASESIRVSANTWIRTIPTNVTTVFETADAVETSRNAGTWITGYFSADGIHPNATGFTAMATAFSAIQLT